MHAGRLVAATVLALSLGATTVSAAQPAAHPKVTLTILISGSGQKGWGVVTFKKKHCSLTACGFRVRPGVLLHLRERPANQSKHPFRYWQLPGGKKVHKKAVTLKIRRNSALSAVYRK